MEGDLSVRDAEPDHQLGHVRGKELANDQLHAARPPLPKRSLARSIAIVATCTGAMLVNVRPCTF